MSGDLNLLHIVLDYKDRGLIKFRRYIIHNLRNQIAAGSDSPSMDKAASDALWKTREELYQMMMKDENLKADIDKQEAWSLVLQDLMFFRRALLDLSLKAGAEVDAAKLKTLSETTTTSGLVGDALIEGVESKLAHKDDKSWEDKDAK